MCGGVAQGVFQTPCRCTERTNYRWAVVAQCSRRMDTSPPNRRFVPNVFQLILVVSPITLFAMLSPVASSSRCLPLEVAPMPLDSTLHLAPR